VKENHGATVKEVKAVQLHGQWYQDSAQLTMMVVRGALIFLTATPTGKTVKLMLALEACRSTCGNLAQSAIMTNLKSMAGNTVDGMDRITFKRQEPFHGSLTALSQVQVGRYAQVACYLKHRHRHRHL